MKKSHENTQKKWHNINWKLCEQQLVQQQNRLVIATQEGKTREVRRMQNQLVRMFAARALAVRKVTTNRGKQFTIFIDLPWVVAMS
jgi:RNA-directed DNA polymerase